MNVTNICMVCGKEFIVTRYNKKLCSIECRAERKRIAEREYRVKHFPSRRSSINVNHKKTRKKMLSLTEIAMKAKEAGLSYGEYVAKMSGGGIDG